MIVDEIYDALTDDAALSALPTRLATELGARSCTLQAFSPDNQFLMMVQNGYFSQEMYDFYIASGMHQHDYWRPAFERPGRLNRAFSAERILDPRGYVDSVFYNDFFRRFGDDTGRFLGAVVAHADGVLNIALQRGLPHAAFDETHERALQPLIVHLRRLFAMRANFAAATHKALMADQLLDALPQAVLVLDTQARLRFANRRGEALLVAGGPFAIRGGAIRAVEVAADLQFADLVRAAADGSSGHGGAMTLPAPAGERLRAQVTPWRGQGHTQVLVVVDDTDALDPGLMHRLAGLYGLTVAEAETVSALVRGLSPAETAEARGVALATIRTQIQHALQKSDARSLTDLIRRGASLPRGPRDD